MLDLAVHREAPFESAVRGSLERSPGGRRLLRLRHGHRDPYTTLADVTVFCWMASGGHSWQGRVVYAAQLRAGEWALVEAWVDAALLAPA